MKSLFRLTAVDAFCAGTVRVTSNDVNGSGNSPHHGPHVGSSLPLSGREKASRREGILNRGSGLNTLMGIGVTPLFCVSFFFFSSGRRRN
jgi:hypothetical protein